ncbi:MAG TPA: DUF4209 domain-containing protein [Nitrososphaera sp.]|nr:DUF4209 domain-containing protein [Nitrososphaera sp.]
METLTPLTKEIIEQYGWQEMIAGCEEKERFRYCSLFCAKATEAHEAGDCTAQEVFSLLGKATIVATRSDSKNEPYPEHWLLSFTDEQISLFRELVHSVRDAEMRARLADIVWERRHDPDMGRLAIDSYLESAWTLEDPLNWVHCADKIERAIHIARLLGKKSEHFAHVVTHIEEVLERYDGEDPLFFSAVLMELLQEHRQGDAQKYASLASKAAERAVAEKQWERARRYLNIAAEWHFLASQPEKARNARIEWIETYVQEAEEIINTSGRAAPYNHASHKIERAMKAYQDLGGSDAKERRSEVYRLLVEYQQKINEEFINIPHPTGDDLKEMDAFFTEYAVNQVKGKDTVEALMALAFLPALGSVSRLREQMENHVRESPTALLFPFVMYSTDGRVTARPSSRPASREQQIEEQVTAQMFESSSRLRQWTAQTLLLPAIEQINEEHHIRQQDLVPVVLGSPFVPEGREALFARGLYAGLTGDYVMAAHLLAPQIENSLRYILQLQGEVTSNLTRHDAQNLYDLNRILNDPKLEAKLIQVLGEDHVFHLKGLLVQHYGANLRNEIAHGTLGVNEFNSAFYGLQSIYLWWLTLRLCLASRLSTGESSQLEETPL